MIIVNTTFIINTEIQDLILNWIKASYIPSALKFEHNGHSLVAKILGNDQPGCVSVAVHLCFGDMETAKKWNEGLGNNLRNILSNRWGEQVMTFHTYLQTLDGYGELG